MNQVELVVDAKANLGEGAIWDSKKHLLYWVDIEGHLVHLYDPQTNQDRAIPVGQPVGAVVPRKSGGLMVALKRGFAALDPETKKITFLNDPEKDLPNNRFNDGKCDPAGRFWAGTMSVPITQGAGSLYCLFPDLTARRMIERVSVSNGIVWSLNNRTMYYIDSAESNVCAYNYDLETGSIKNKRVVIQMTEADGAPDGMTMDAEGKVWIAHWGGYKVTRWDPEKGKLLLTQPIPAKQVTSCAFGGPKMDQLYVTTAAHNLDAATLAAHPHTGGLFRFDPGVCGIPAPEFAG